MNKQNLLQEVEQEVAKTLENLESLPKLEAEPFFDTRLEAKIKYLHPPKKNNLNLQWQLILLRAAMITLLVGLNITVLLQVWGSQTTHKHKNHPTSSFNNFLSEYQLNADKGDIYSNFQ